MCTNKRYTAPDFCPSESLSISKPWLLLSNPDNEQGSSTPVAIRGWAGNMAPGQGRRASESS